MPVFGDIMNRLEARAYSTSWFQPPPLKSLYLLLAGPTGSVSGAAG
jgi:hypothetical protein